jgi:hypothetical protein
MVWNRTCDGPADGDAADGCCVWLVGLNGSGAGAYDGSGGGGPRDIEEGTNERTNGSNESAIQMQRNRIESNGTANTHRRRRQ